MNQVALLVENSFVANAQTRTPNPVSVYQLQRNCQLLNVPGKSFVAGRRHALMKEKDRSEKNNEAKEEKRPKLQSIAGNPDAATVTPKIRRIAQPGDVLFPRAVAYRADLKATTRFVAMWLYDHLQPGTNLANGSQDLIAEELGLTRRTVIKSLDELWDKRIITKIERINKKGGGFYLCYGMQMFPSDSCSCSRT